MVYFKDWFICLSERLSETVWGFIWSVSKLAFEGIVALLEDQFLEIEMGPIALGVPGQGLEQNLALISHIRGTDLSG